MVTRQGQGEMGHSAGTKRFPIRVLLAARPGSPGLGREAAEGLNEEKGFRASR